MSIVLVDHFLGGPPNPDRRLGNPAPGGMIELSLTFEVSDGTAVVNGILTEAAQLAHEVDLAVAAKRDEVFAQSRRLEATKTQAGADLADAERRIKAGEAALRDALLKGTCPAEVEKDLAAADADRAALIRRVGVLNEQLGGAWADAHRQFAVAERQVRADALAKLQPQIDAANARLSQLVEQHFPDLAVLKEAKRLIRGGQ